MSKKKIERFIDHQYNVKFVIGESEVNEFKFVKENSIVSYENYQDLPKAIPLMSSYILEDASTRKACLTLNSLTNNSCFISCQFLIHKSTLNVLVNFRSQHANMGRPTDEMLIKYLTTLLLDRIKNKIEIKKVSIYVRVGDYHIY
jgi:hypothetical protein